MNSIISISDLWVEYHQKDHSVCAIKGINLSIGKGEVLGIVGESGSGKSTLALAILNLLKFKNKVTYRGEISFSCNGIEKNLLILPEKDMQSIRGKEISMIFQDPFHSFNPVKRIGKQLIEIISDKLNTEERKGKALKLLETVNIKDPERIYMSFPHEISGGQTQRAMLAIALAREPSLLIADEATTNLDTLIQREIIELLKKLKRQKNWSMLFISHDLALVAELADRIVVMKNGLIEEIGSPIDLLQHPQSGYTKVLFRNLILHEEKNEEGKEDHKDSIIRDKDDSVSNILEIKQLSKWYPGKKSFLGHPKSFTIALDNLSLVVGKSEILGIVGESGSGKTTLAKIILKLIEPDDGIVMYNGEKIAPSEFIHSKFNHSIQLIFQNPKAAFNPRQSVGDAIIEVIRLHQKIKTRKTLKAKTLKLLDQVGLSIDHFNRLASELSGGQQQRANIARALAVKPSLIILDEPVSSLDVSLRRQILDLLKSLRSEYGLSLLIISHDLSVVRYMCDRVVVMKEGAIVEMASTMQLFSQPENSYTKQLIEASPRIL